MPSALLEFFDKLLAATMEENITQVLMLSSVFNKQRLMSSQNATCTVTLVKCT